MQRAEECGTFDSYIWTFVGGMPLVNRRSALTGIPRATPESDAMSAGLEKRGFRFVGSTICYAFTQATGMVNDHVTSCFRFGELSDETSGRAKKEADRGVIAGGPTGMRGGKTRS
jgi:DNA-3-methyladenine glycosylase I